jgi:hypothetical protein
MFNFQGNEENGTMSVAKGDVIVVELLGSESPWWPATHAGRRGLVPASYIQQLSAEEAEMFAAAASSREQGSAAAEAAKAPALKAVAVFNFTGNAEDGTLSIRVGDELLVEPHVSAAGYRVLRARWCITCARRVATSAAPLPHARTHPPIHLPAPVRPPAPARCRTLCAFACAM